MSETKIAFSSVTFSQKLITPLNDSQVFVIHKKNQLTRVFRYGIGLV